MLKSRISWIDVARGIGIILVIYGHTLSSHGYRYLIYSFHMPLFFLLSGIVFSYDKYNLRTTFKKSVKGLLIPYVFFAIISYVIYLSHNDMSSLSVVKVVTQMSGIIYGNSSTLFFNDILWFLPCLFAAKMGFAIIAKLLKRKEIIFVSLVVFSLLGYFVSFEFPEIRLPFGAESALTAIVFLGLGSIYTTNRKVFNHAKLYILFKKYSFLVMVLFAAVCVVVATISFNLYGHQADIRLNHLNNYFLYYIASMSGIITTIILSKIIRKNVALEYIGRNTLVLFALHPIIFFYIALTTNIIFTDSLLKVISPISPFLYTILSIVIILFINLLFRKTNKYLSRIY